MANAEDIKFGQLAVALSLIEPAQLASCLQWQEEETRKGRPWSLAECFIQKNLLAPEQIDLVQERLARSSTVLGATELRERSSPSANTKTLGRYKLLAEIGRGGMGKVYKAYDPQLDRLVALKILLVGDGQKEVERFLREAQAMAKLRHPYIVGVYDIGQEEGNYFFTMDLIAGVSLHEFLRQSPLSTRQMVNILIKVANAIHYAHTQGIIHRDLKPANIMIDQDHEPKVMDFGLAKVIGSTNKLSVSGAVLGTIQYMSPEQAAGRGREVDERTDVYALGAILYEMMTGVPPFTGRSFSQVLEGVLHREPIRPTQLKARMPKALENICLKALEKEKEKRYPQAMAMAEDLARFAEGKAISARSRGLWARLSRRSKLYLGITGSAVLLAAVLWYLRTVSPSPLVEIGPRAGPASPLPLAAPVDQTPAQPTVAEVKPKGLPKYDGISWKRDTRYFHLFTGHKVDTRTGRIAFMNAGPGPVQVKLYHPTRPRQVLDTQEVPPETNEYLGSHLGESHWGIQVNDSPIFTLSAVGEWRFWENVHLFQVSHDRFGKEGVVRAGKVAFSNTHDVPVVARLYHPDNPVFAFYSQNIPAKANLFLGNFVCGNDWGIQLDNRPVMTLGVACEWNFFQGAYVFQSGTVFCSPPGND